MSEVLRDVCENLTREVKQLNSKPDISPTELDRMYKAVDIIKDIKTIEAMEDAGYSNMGSYYDDGMSYAMRGYGGNSYARGRDSMGRYTSRDEGPMSHDDKEHLKRQIQEMQAKLDRM